VAPRRLAGVLRPAGTVPEMLRAASGWNRAKLEGDRGETLALEEPAGERLPGARLVDRARRGSAQAGRSVLDGLWRGERRSRAGSSARPSRSRNKLGDWADRTAERQHETRYKWVP
jgi:hypothetical protein